LVCKGERWQSRRSWGAYGCGNSEIRHRQLRIKNAPNLTRPRHSVERLLGSRQHSERRQRKRELHILNPSLRFDDGGHLRMVIVAVDTNRDSEACDPDACCQRDGHYFQSGIHGAQPLPVAEHDLTGAGKPEHTLIVQLRKRP
jgi:hypothetical protein